MKGLKVMVRVFVLIWTASLANLAGSDIIAVSSVFFLYLWTCICFFSSLTPLSILCFSSPLPLKSLFFNHVAIKYEELFLFISCFWDFF